MNTNDYSSLEEYATGLFDAYMGLPMDDAKNLTGGYLDGFKRAKQDQLDNPLDIRVTIL